MGRRRSRAIDALKRRAPIFVLLAADAAALMASVALSLRLRFDDEPWPLVYQRHLEPFTASLPIIVLIYLCLFSKFRLYRYAWRFASLDTLWSVISANSIGLAGLAAVQLLLYRHTFPYSVLTILWAASTITIGGVRICLRLLSMAGRYRAFSLQLIRSDVMPKRAVIVGCGCDGVAALRALRQDPDLNYSVVGFLDDDPNKKGSYVGSVRVLGSMEILNRLLSEKAVDEVIVALPPSGGARLREYVLECRKRKIDVKVLPQLGDVLQGRASFQLADISVEDLLRRHPADQDNANFGGYLSGKRVLVTGAGGSIGSELCRQIMSLQPASLVLLGHGENSVHAIYHELVREWPAERDNIHCVIASVAHERRIRQVFDRFRPQVVFHAAAHKHVPMMEANEREAVHNNVLGTQNVAENSGRFGVERIVLISTDKAADPCCVMGATKRLCEEVFRAEATVWPRTCYVTVRFGNVLGSRGSVVPLFREQISRGGPVTVTHPQMTRYFMTIPEAVRLVLQAGAVGHSGELYLLDMGEPIRVLDLAKDMIRLCGLEPGKDIEIAFTGMRPGEKIHERLVASDESIQPTPWEGLSLVIRPDCADPTELLEGLARLARAADYGASADVRQMIRELLPRPRTSSQHLPSLNSQPSTLNP